MLELLLYSSISCETATQIIERVKLHEHLDNETKQEIIVTLKEATPKCPWDAND